MLIIWHDNTRLGIKTKLRFCNYSHASNAYWPYMILFGRRHNSQLLHDLKYNDILMYQNRRHIWLCIIIKLVEMNMFLYTFEVVSKVVLTHVMHYKLFWWILHHIVSHFMTVCWCNEQDCQSICVWDVSAEKRSGNLAVGAKTNEYCRTS
jgi:hypothetical protein